jgi:hypothetical protein
MKKAKKRWYYRLGDLVKSYGSVLIGLASLIISTHFRK